MAKRNKNRVEFKLNSAMVAIIIILVGLLFVILSHYEFNEPYTWWVAWGKSTVNTLGTTLMASAVVSFILEVSNLKSIFAEVLGNVLGESFPLDAYSEDNLDKFHLRIAAYLSGGNIPFEQLRNNIYAYEKKIRDQLAETYYDYHSSKYYYTPDEKNGVFEVTAETKYKIINKYGKDNAISFRIKTYAINGGTSEEEYANNFTIKKFKINGQDVDLDCVKLEDIPKNVHNKGYYDYKIRIDKPLGKEKEYEIELAYDYKMPISDISQSNKMTKCCKNMEHVFKIYPDKGTKEAWSLHGAAFTSFFCKQKESENDFKVDQTSDDTVRIRFNKWVLPGSGYVITLTKDK